MPTLRLIEQCRLATGQLIQALLQVVRKSRELSLRGRDDENANPLASLVMVIVAPLAAMMIQFAISRQREFKADAVGAQISGRPLALASALQKLDAYSRRIPMHVAPAAAPLAQVNPLAASGSGMMKLFSTHPATEERVNRLRALAAA